MTKKKKIGSTSNATLQVFFIFKSWLHTQLYGAVLPLLSLLPQQEVCFSQSGHKSLSIFLSYKPAQKILVCVLRFLWSKGKLFTSSFDFSFSLFPFRSSLGEEMKQLQQIVNIAAISQVNIKYCHSGTCLFWSKNSMDKLIISSSVIILLSSSATSPLSSLEPLAAAQKFPQ